MIEELHLAGGTRLPLGGRRESPHEHPGGVDPHRQLLGVLHREGRSAVDVSDLEKDGKVVVD